MNLNVLLLLSLLYPSRLVALSSAESRWLEIQDALTFADVCGLQHQESAMGFRIVWDIHVFRMQRQA